MPWPTKYTQCQRCTSLTLYVTGNHGNGECTALRYVGVRGEYGAPLRDKPVIATYEARAMPSDHKAKEEAAGGAFQMQ